MFTYQGEMRMTNTGPATNPGNITVTGQRRRPDGSFPSGGGGGGGGSGEAGGTSPDIQDEQDPGSAWRIAAGPMRRSGDSPAVECRCRRGAIDISIRVQSGGTR